MIMGPPAGHARPHAVVFRMELSVRRRRALMMRPIEVGKAHAAADVQAKAGKGPGERRRREGANARRGEAPSLCTMPLKPHLKHRGCRNF